jgi:methionyl aminopeptidase
VPIGTISPQRQRLITTAHDAMMAGIRAAAPGRHIGDIGYAMQLYAASHGFHVLPQFTGHGLGRRMHEEPSVPSVGRPGTGPVMPDGLVITIEPILVEKSPRVRVDPDGWTIRTVDGGWAAQFEHTVVVRPGGAEVLSAL